MGKDEETEICVEWSVLDVCSSFDVGRSMFDVRRSSFKTTLHWEQHAITPVLQY